MQGGAYFPEVHIAVLLHEVGTIVGGRVTQLSQIKKKDFLSLIGSQQN